jgi:hypothetical protein
MEDEFEELMTDRVRYHPEFLALFQDLKSICGLDARKEFINIMETEGCIREFLHPEAPLLKLVGGHMHNP